MNIVFFAHPDFLGQQSMPRFVNMLAEGMHRRGINVEVWSPRPRFFNLSAPQKLKKWLGYIDQFIVFPTQVRRRLIKCSEDTLFVISDHALGPWVPLVADRRHVIHCHDFLAQRSALDEIPQNPTRYTGKRYQSYIRNGYKKGKNFISASNKTKEDLEKFLNFQPKVSEVVYNGLNQAFMPRDHAEARSVLGQKTGFDLTSGFLLHVGGNQWYKNRAGVIEIYNAWRRNSSEKLPLLLIGKEPVAGLKKIYNQSPYKAEIHFLNGLEDKFVQTAYTGATVFLFPSLAEGFGWPIAEAMASGCPVITTNEAPMTEVAGGAGFFITRRPNDSIQALRWADESANVLNRLIQLTPDKRKAVIEAGILNAKRFDPDTVLDKIEKIYRDILVSEKYL